MVELAWPEVGKTLDEEAMKKIFDSVQLKIRIDYALPRGIDAHARRDRYLVEAVGGLRPDLVPEA